MEELTRGAGGTAPGLIYALAHIPTDAALATALVVRIDCNGAVSGPCGGGRGCVGLWRWGWSK